MQIQQDLFGKSESPNKTNDNRKRALILNSIHRKDFWCLSNSMSYSSPTELRIYFVVMFFTYSGMEQNLHTKTSKNGVRESISSMSVLQERSLMIDHIDIIS